MKRGMWRPCIMSCRCWVDAEDGCVTARVNTDSCKDASQCVLRMLDRVCKGSDCKHRCCVKCDTSGNGSRSVFWLGPAAPENERVAHDKPSEGHTVHLSQEEESAQAVVTLMQTLLLNMESKEMAARRVQDRCIGHCISRCIHCG